MSLKILQEIVSIDLLKEGCKEEVFIGRPFYLDYEKALILVADAWKFKVGGIPQGAFLLAFYENGDDAGNEALLLRVLRPTSLPTDNDVTSSMIEYYKDDLKTTDPGSDLDQFTKYEFSFSGIECRVLGTFYRDEELKKVGFGADVENFYSAHNYKVYKPTEKVLSYIVNGGLSSKHNVQIGHVRYSSSKRFQERASNVEACISPKDFLGKRTALFGMTRTGKSNTVKKIIEATNDMSEKAKGSPDSVSSTSPEETLKQFDTEDAPKYPVGQIIFDINGEYANANLQDGGTAIFELFPKKVTRYSVIEKQGFKIMKTNFYYDIEAGFDLIATFLSEEGADYVHSFLSVNMEKPEDMLSGAGIKYNRKKAAYLCCLHKAGFTAPNGFKISFQSNKELQEALPENLKSLEPNKGISLEDAQKWFEHLWANYETLKNKTSNGDEFADEDLKHMMVFLTGKHGNRSVNGFKKLNPIKKYHTVASDGSFATEIVQSLRKGDIIIVDLSQGDPTLQTFYSEKICRAIFTSSMDHFIKNEPNNFIQMYFEEAHNLFPKKEEKDLSMIYNRIAKEGAKLQLGLIYATQEVSSISSNILKNTQNWFISHLNNEDEIKELRKYYDFSDFADSLIKFSPTKDPGFVRMKTYSNPFVVPVQIDRFLVTKK